MRSDLVRSDLVRSDLVRSDPMTFVPKLERSGQNLTASARNGNRGTLRLDPQSRGDHALPVHDPARRRGERPTLARPERDPVGGSTAPRRPLFSRRLYPRGVADRGGDPASTVGGEPPGRARAVHRGRRARRRDRAAPSGSDAHPTDAHPPRRCRPGDHDAARHPLPSHARRDERRGINLVLGSLATLVAVGRTRWAPIADRAAATRSRGSA